MIDIPNFTGTPLYKRIMWAEENLPPVEPEYVVFYEDPARPDDGVVELWPAAAWMGLAMAGGILPPIEAWLSMKFELVDADTRAYQCDFVEAQELRIKHKITFERLLDDGAVTYSQALPAMTQEEAIRYLVKKDIPHRVWSESRRTNRPLYEVMPVSQLPKDRTFQSAWTLQEA